MRRRSQKDEGLKLTEVARKYRRAPSPATPHRPNQSMGRSAVKVEPIEDAAKRRATFQKRRGGIMKKAMELSVLCHCDIALVLFDEHGDLHQFASTDMKATLTRALAHKGKRDQSSNQSLLRSHGVMKQRAAVGAHSEPIGNRIDLTPSSACGLSLSAGSFGPLLHSRGPKRARPESPRGPGDLPRAPHRICESEDDDDANSPQSLRLAMNNAAVAVQLEPTQPADAAGARYATTLPPRVQRNVDTLMRDISLVHAAGELVEDPFMLTQPPHRRPDVVN